MMNEFEGWFPIDETGIKDDIETYKERFAADSTKRRTVKKKDSKKRRLIKKRKG